MSKTHLTLAVLTAALLAPLAWTAISPASPAPPATAWEYKVVSLAEFVGNPFDALKDAFEPEEKGEDVGLLEAAMRAEARQAKKREEFLNGFGKEGWELIDWGVKTATFKRPAN